MKTASEQLKFLSANHSEYGALTVSNRCKTCLFNAAANFHFQAVDYAADFIHKSFLID